MTDEPLAANAGPSGRPDPELLVAANTEALVDHVTDRLLAAITAAQRARQSASLLISGGRVMGQVLSMLASFRPKDAIVWDAVDIWWADERWVPANSSDRNDRELSPLLASVAVDPGRVHRMPASDGGFSTPEAAADSYAGELAASAAARRDPGPVPRFDVALLGVGEDGHCASLFPEAPGVHVTDLSVISVHGSPKPPPVRLTLTFPALAQAEQVWFVSAGAGKANAVALALSGTAGPVQVPAAGPRGRLRTLWLVDRAAAASLPSRLYTPPVG